MAADNTPKLPEDVAAQFKYCGNGAQRYIVGGKTYHVETLTKDQAEALAAAKVHFLKRKRKPKPKTTD